MGPRPNRVSAMFLAGGYPALAQAFFTAAGITDATQKNAVAGLVTALDGYGLLSKLFALYPVVGGTASSHSYNLINPATFQITWVGGITHDANGWQGNGSTGYGNTNFNASSSGWLADSASMHTYIRNNTASGYDMGASTSSVSNTSVMVARYTASTTAFGWLKNNAAGINGVNADSRGMYSLVRGAANVLTMYRNGSSLFSGAPGAGSYYNGNLFWGAEDRGGSAIEFSNHQYGMGAIGLTLDATEAANFYTAVQAYQTALGRQV